MAKLRVTKKRRKKIVEKDQLDMLTSLIDRSHDMCPICKELFDQIIWDLIKELEKIIDIKKRTR
jgi:transposase